MSEREPVVAIDGPVGAGKSTVARRVAERLGFTLIPTGAMYRAVALSVARAAIAPTDDAALARHLASVTVSVRGARVLLDGEDVTDAVRSPEIGRLTSDLSTRPAVRGKLTPLQRAAAAPGGAVLEGRDTGTVVCPDAEVKVFLTASLESRARRRQAELAAMGVAADLEAVRAEVRARDRQDTGRALAPLTAAADAITLDTSDLTVAEVVGRIVDAVERCRCCTRS
jgi:cytidylate kinase